MANNQSFPLLLIIPLILNFLLSPPSFVLADTACPYPCLPPPIAGTTTPAPPAPKTPTTTQPGSYSYPPPLPPSTGDGDFPNYPPPDGTGDTGGGGYGGSTMMPPPPDPILPYFPYYYRNGVHRESDQPAGSSSAGLAFQPSMMSWVIMMLMPIVLVLPYSMFS